MLHTMRRALPTYFVFAVSTSLLINVAPASATEVCKVFGPDPVIGISNEGSVVQFESPVGRGHIRTEGYLLCNLLTPLAYHVDGVDASNDGGFGPATCTCPSDDQCHVVRTTVDGTVKLKQVFKYHPAKRALDVTMTVTNLTSSPATLLLSRYADFDVDAYGDNGTGALVNYWAADTDSVFAWNSGNNEADSDKDHMMILRDVNPVTTRDHIAISTAVNDFGCLYGLGSSADVEFGNFAGRLEYEFDNVPRKGAVSALIGYERN